MNNNFSRVIIWGGGLAIIQLITLIVLLFNFGRNLAFTVNNLLVLPMVIAGIWGGARVRRFGYIFSKKFL